MITIELTELLIALLGAAGIPSAITAALIRKSEKRAEQRAAKQEEQVNNIRKMFLFNVKAGRATYVLAKATAIAVQRNPDFHCNGDMTNALENSENWQKEEQQFIIDQGLQKIFSTADK